MSISMNNVMNNNVVREGSFAENKQLRDKLINKLYAEFVVIRKFTIEFDDENNMKIAVKYGTIGMSPVVEAFGVRRDVRINNVPVNVPLFAGSDETKAVKVNIDGVKYIYCDSLVTMECKDQAKMEQLTGTGFEFDGNVYRVSGSSPSTEKHSVKYCYRVSDKIETERQAFEIMDNVSGNVFSAAFGKLMTGKAVTKLNTRFGNYLTTMKCLAEIDLTKECIAIVHKDKATNNNGSIDGDYDFEEEVLAAMEAVGIEIDNHINDGAQYISVELAQRIGRSVGMKLSYKGALKAAFQMRCTVLTTKCMSRTLEQEDMMRIAKYNNATFYGNTNGPLATLVDEDGAKLINVEGLKANKTIKVEIMAMAKASNVHTSSQSLIKYMAVNPQETVKFLKEQMKDNMKEYYMGKLNDTEAQINNVNNRLIAALGRDSLEVETLNETLLKDVMKYAQSAIAKNRIAIPGVYSHMMFDLTYALTNGRIDRVLGMNKDGFVEAYSEDVCRMYAKEIAEIEKDNTLTEEQKDEKLFALLSGIVVKYPSAMPKEYEIVVYQTKRQMRRKIERLTKNNEERDILLAYFENTPYGCTVYAPINAMKNKLAGADVDFDATMTDMSDMKWILINQRLEERKTDNGYMGDCTIIVYGDVKRTHVDEDIEL